jgi:hypothetical protein
LELSLLIATINAINQSCLRWCGDIIQWCFNEEIC